MARQADIRRANSFGRTRLFVPEPQVALRQLADAKIASVVRVYLRQSMSLPSVSDHTGVAGGRAHEYCSDDDSDA